jgi:outer membrane protein assembly factor BamA
LESVSIEGSSIAKPVVLEISALKLGAPIDKGGIEQACQRIQDTGLFASISFRYAPGPKKGYALTLVLTDHDKLTEATIDVPGADEDEAWKWLAARFGRFDRKVPQADSAQQYLARQLEQHLSGRLRGQPLAVRMENDFRTRRLTLSFQPEVLPRLQSITCAGNEAVRSPEILALLNRVAGNEAYTDRKFLAALEMNLRPLYEQRGFYRVTLQPGRPQVTDAGVSVNVAITEGEPYQLGRVDIEGDELPVRAMLAAARFPTGKLANWKQIQEGIWEIEKVVRRMGFVTARATPARSFDDTAHVLHLRIPVVKGPLYRYGEIRFSGLGPELEEKARRIWQKKPGDPYDYLYSSEFFQALSRTVDILAFRKHQALAKKGAGENVMDVELVFERR